MILLPSRGRPRKLARFFEAYAATHATEPGIVMIEPQDRDPYSRVTLPDGWRLVEVPPSMVSKKFNDGALVYCPGERTYQVMADDCLPETEYWDQLLLEAAGTLSVAYGNDFIDPPPPCGHPCIGGDLVRALGFIAPPRFGHFYWDNALADIAAALGKDYLRYLPHVVTRHLHWTLTGEYDETCRARGCSEDDQIIYERWRTHRMRDDVARVIAQYGGVSGL